MAIVVAYKYAANPQDTSVNADGFIDWSRAKMAVSEYDPVAIQLGRDLANVTNEELVGISVGPVSLGSSMAKKNAMSKGLDRALIVADDLTADWNMTKVASVLAEMVTKIKDVELLITGDSSVDEGARMMSALVAGYLGWPCFQEVASVEKTSEGWLIVQLISGGTQKITVSGPVVIAALSDAVEAKIPSMKDVLAAGKKPVDSLPLADLSPAEIELDITSRSKPETKTRKNQIFSGEDAAEQLVAALKNAGLI